MGGIPYHGRTGRDPECSTLGRGAYGLRLDGVASCALVPAKPSWPILEVERQVGRSDALDRLDHQSALLALRNGGGIALCREPLRATFTVPFELGDAELVHPYLAPAAAAVGWWLGRESFHGGGLVIGDGAYGILGDRGAGKSSLLAWMAGQAASILADDVVVVDRDGEAYAGPRTIDLRAGAASALGVGEHLGVVGARERWRLSLGVVPGQAPVRGWFFLAWGERLTIRRLGVAERLPRLAANRAVRLPAADERLLLRLAALPGWELTRPRGWERLEEAAVCLLETASTPRGAPPG